MRPGARPLKSLHMLLIAASLLVIVAGAGTTGAHGDADGRAPAPQSPPPAPAALQPPAEPARRGGRALGEHTTSFAVLGDELPRATNIRRAASLLEGVRIAPGARFSFNDAVGERTLARGFVRARILRGGAYDEGIGGGICQLASTVLVAALRAGVPIDRARPHSRLQRYAPPGMDVAIAWQRSDLWFSNDFDVPLSLEVTLAPDGDREAVTVRLIGDAAPRDVEVVLHTRRDIAAPERVRIDRDVPEGERRVVAEGVRGAEVRRRRTIRYPDGRELVERADLRYPPVAREVRVRRLAP